MSAGPTRRAVVAGAGALGATLVLPAPARAAGRTSHGLSSFGDLKYPPDFPNFDYVNPDAPRGGRFSAQLAATFGNQASDTFNTLNVYVLRGDGAAGMNLTFDSLMVRALDEPDALYGLLARSVEVSEDGLSYRFALRPQARFHDGSRLTARDVAASLTLLKEKGHPEISQVIRDLAEVVPEGDDAVTLRFAPAAAATCRSSWPPCRCSRPATTRAVTSRPRRWSRRWAPAPTRSGAWSPGASSSSSG